MDDVIYRRDAVDALNVGAELLRRVLDDADVVGVEREKYEWGLGLIESYISDMKELSSAQSDVPVTNVGDMVYRQDAIDAIGEKPFAGTADEYDYEQGLQNQWERDVVAIKILPPAQPERKNGRWILSEDREWQSCSECGADVDVSMGLGVYVDNDEISEMRFCPNCGARMDGEDE